MWIVTDQNCSCSIFAGLAILCNLALMLTWIPASLAFHQRYCHASCCCCLVRSPPPPLKVQSSTKYQKMSQKRSKIVPPSI